MLRCAGEGICGVDDGGEREEGDGTADSRVGDRSHEAQHHSTRSVCLTCRFCSRDNFHLNFVRNIAVYHTFS
jgi:hypothetical protein